MSYTQAYCVPNYYSYFHCKCSACRTTCCHGWSVSLSMGEYYRLLGIGCSEELRRKLDCAFYMVDHPTKERYALINRNWEGNCPMLVGGLCALQKECGEDILPAVCRYYPRGPRIAPVHECSISNSCEGILELLFQQQAPITFEQAMLSFQMPQELESLNEVWQVHYQDIRRYAIDVLQDRSMALPERLILLGQFMARLRDALRKDATAVPALIVEMEQVKAPPLIPADYETSLPIQQAMACVFAKHSRSIRQNGLTAQRALGLTDKTDISPEKLPQAIMQYQAGIRHLDNILPKWHLYFEKMMVNHVFFEQFLFSDIHENIWEAYGSLCAVYALLRFLIIGGMADKQSLDDFVDIAAAAFRLIDHSAFDRNVATLLEDMGCISKQKLAILVRG